MNVKIVVLFSTLLDYRETRANVFAGGWR